MSILTYCFLFFTIILFALFIMEPNLRKNEVLQKSIDGNNEDVENSFLDSNDFYIKFIGGIININPTPNNIKYLERLKSAGLYGYKYLVYYKSLKYILSIFFALLLLILILFTRSFQDFPFIAKISFVAIASICGFFAPDLYIKNKATKRRDSIKKSWSDALDLMLVCVESGMTIEMSLKLVSEKISFLCDELSKEILIVINDFNMYKERKEAYESFARRLNLESVDAFVQCIIQAERYGTPVGNALRVLAQEHRDQRMQLAERKAAALPPKLTVPMILFFLPVIFAVILTPAIIQVSAQGGIMGGN